MELTWYGTANIVLTEGDERIVFDPFAGYPIGRSVRATCLRMSREIFPPLKNVFITHGHFDHIGHIPYFYRDADTKIYGTKTPCRTLKKKKIPEKELCRIYPGWEGEVGPFSVRAFQGRHCKFDLPIIIKTGFCARFWKNPIQMLLVAEKVVRYPEAGEILFYEVSANDLRIQIMGSLGLDDKTEYPVGADYLILPFQGRSDLETYSMKFVERLKPKAILLDHYDDAFPPFSQTIETEGFCKLANERMGIPCRALGQGETISL